MIPKSSAPAYFYRLREGQEPVPDDLGGPVAGRVESLPTTAGPWSAPGAARRPACGPARTCRRGPRRPGWSGGSPWTCWARSRSASSRSPPRCVRPGRSVCPAEAALRDVALDRPVAQGLGLAFPRTDSGPAAAGPHPTTGPRTVVARTRPEGWSPGYLDAVEWRWITGAVDAAGPGVVWMRPPVLVEGEPITPLQRLLTCVDSASGVSARSTSATWAFLNTELTVHVLREPVGEWICLDAVTTLGPGSVGVADLARRTTRSGRSPGRPRRCWCSVVRAPRSRSAPCRPCPARRRRGRRPSPRAGSASAADRAPPRPRGRRRPEPQ